MAYNISPAPTSGTDAFGKVPGQLGLPNSIYDQLNANVPNYGALTKTATNTIGSELSGKLSPEAMNLIQNKAAANGISSGTGIGSGFQQNNMLANLGLTAEQLQQHGLTDYNQFSNTQGNQQLDPALQTEIATQNAVDAAAPNPAAAQSYAQMLFDKYLNGGGGASKNSGGASYSFIPASSVQFGSQTNTQPQSIRY